MKAIDQLEALIGGMKSVFAPVLQTQLETLIAQIKAEKPTVVVNIGGGLVAYIAASCDVNVIVVDQDTEGYSDPIKKTPSGHKAVVYISSADIVPKERIAEWIALANQE